MSVEASSVLTSEKNWGAAINPFILVSDGRVSAALSHFDHRLAQESSAVLYFDHSEGVKHHRLEYHHRWYLRRKIEGTYLSVVARYNHLGGMCQGGCGFEMEDYVDGSEYGNVDRFGLGIGMGVRYFYESGVYVGVGFIVGRYLTGERKFISSGYGDGSVNQFSDIQFIKIGRAF